MNLEVNDILSYNKEDLEKYKLAREIAKLNVEIERETATLTEHQHKSNRAKSSADSARVYTFYEAVKSASVERCMEELGIWSRRDPGQDIKIILNSPGGNVLDGLALYDYIQQLRGDGHKIEVVGLGMAASMGGILLQAGDIRTMGKNSWMLIHEVSSGAIGNLSEIEDEVEFIKRLQNGLVEILAERSHLTATQIKRKWKKKDWWLSAGEALELGFIDGIQD